MDSFLDVVVGGFITAKKKVIKNHGHRAGLSLLTVTYPV
ncbi:hypothetical protein AC520_4276 [Enterobacter sp. OLF]|nr:hypothetical protein AC520_4276 [Enterobacter sp. OLF]